MCVCSHSQEYIVGLAEKYVTEIEREYRFKRTDPTWKWHC